MEKINVTINGSQVSGGEGMTILEVAQENGIDIPTLCYHQRLAPIGACRLCVVEVEGSRTLVASCHTPISKGMVIYTHSIMGRILPCEMIDTPSGFRKNSQRRKIRS